MKTKSEVESRIIKLKKKHLQLYIQEKCGKTPENCVFNVLHVDKTIYGDAGFKFDRSIEEYEMLPNVSVTALVLNPDSNVIRLCSYGSDKPEEWNGDICDSVAVSKNCNKFIPIKEEEEARNEFDLLLQDDKYVHKNMPDLSSLQWVIGKKSSQLKFSFIRFFICFIRSFFFWSK